MPSLRRFLAPVAAAGIACAAMAAQATPYFEIVGGTVEAQSFPGVPVIPNGALGFENRLSGPGVISVFLRDTEAEDGTRVKVVYDYVGSDAAFLNQFKDSLSVEGASNFRWCNKTTPAECDPGFTPLGAGNQNWFGNFAATESVSVAVGSLVPFHFLAGCDVGVPRCVINGQAAPNADATDETQALAHMGVFNIEGGAFNFATADREGDVLAVGLTDGNFSPDDDDHQDFMVRLSIPEPTSLALSGIALGGLTLARRRAIRGADRR